MIRDRSYLAWLINDTGQLMGVTIFTFVLPMFAIYTTGHPSTGGIVAGAGLAGQMFTVLAGGVLADRADLPTLMRLATGGGLVIALLAVLAVGQDPTLAVIIALNVTMGLRSGLLGVASDAALKAVVDDENLLRATSTNQARDASVSLLGAPMAGALMGLGTTVALAGSAVAFAIGLLGALMVTGRFEREEPEQSDGNNLAAMVSGLSWVMRRPTLRGIVVASLLLNVGLNAAVATVLYDLASRGELSWRIGLVSASIGAGLLVGSLLAARLTSRLPGGPLVFAGIGLTVAAALTLPWVLAVPGIMAVLFLGVLGIPSANAILQASLMRMVPQNQLGRVLSASSLLGMGLVPLAPVVAGGGLELVGRLAVLAGCAVTCALAVLAVATTGALKDLPDPRHTHPEDQTANSPR